jgi:hypothetical protein
MPRWTVRRSTKTLVVRPILERKTKLLSRSGMCYSLRWKSTIHTSLLHCWIAMCFCTCLYC